jgi:hypothetical protein
VRPSFKLQVVAFNRLAHMGGVPEIRPLPKP